MNTGGTGGGRQGGWMVPPCLQRGGRLEPGWTTEVDREERLGLGVDPGHKT